MTRNRSKDRSLVMETRCKDDHRRACHTDEAFNNKVSNNERSVSNNERSVSLLTCPPWVNFTQE